MQERSVACSDLSSLHSYFSTGIVCSCLLCMIGATCQSGCGLCRICVDSAVTTAIRSKDDSFFRQAFDTLSKARQGRVGRTNGDDCLSFIEEKNQSGTRNG